MAAVGGMRRSGNTSTPKIRRWSPLSPPCFLVTARGDFLRHYSRDFAAALKKNGLEAELFDMDEPEKLAHAFAAMLPETAAAQRANAAMADFLQAHI